MYELIRSRFREMAEEHGILDEEIEIRAMTLTPQEAIGNPEDRDYPLIRGRERLMQAEFKGELGQAFTDMFGNYEGSIVDVLEMKLENNFRRAVFVSSLNAVMRSLETVEKTVHCRDEEPRECALALAGHVRESYGDPKIAFVGFQPRMIEALSPAFELRVTDMDEENIGKTKFGCLVHGPDKAQEFLDWCDLALVTGTTAVNDTLRRFCESANAVFYGVTISGMARLMGLNHFCHCGR